MTQPTLQQELGKKYPFDSLEQEAALNLVRTQDYLQHEFTQLFSEHDLSGPQYNVLRILRGHGGDGVPSSTIAGEMITRMPDITRLVDRLEERGLVQRRRTSQDRRLVLVSIAPGGLELLERLDQPVLDMHRRLLAHLTPEELHQLNFLLVKARHPKSELAEKPS